MNHRAAEVAAAHHDAIETEVIVNERVKIAAVCRYVVETLPDVAVAEASKVGDDDVEAGFGERAR